MCPQRGGCLEDETGNRLEEGLNVGIPAQLLTTQLYWGKSQSSLLVFTDDIVSQGADRLYLYLYCIAGVHRTDAAGGAGSNNITR